MDKPTINNIKGLHWLGTNSGASSFDDHYVSHQILKFGDQLKNFQTIYKIQGFIT